MTVWHRCGRRVMAALVLSLSAAVAIAGETVLKSGGYRLCFQSVEGGSGVELRNGWETIALQSSPARIVVKEAGVKKGFHDVETSYAVPYEEVRKQHGAVEARAKVATAGGSVFLVCDRYEAAADGSFVLHRGVEVASAGMEEGFASAYTLSAVSGGESGGYEYFIPSILYRDTEMMRHRAVASDLGVEKVYVKETRCGLPMAMLREKRRGVSFALSHLHPEIGVGGFAGGGVPGEVNDSLRYGAVGYDMSPLPSVTFRYPSAEGPERYENIPGRANGEPVWSDRYHAVRAGNSHSLSVAVIPTVCDGYNEAMKNTFATAYALENPEVWHVDMDTVYRHNIELFKNEYRTFGTGAVKAAGVPWSLDLPDGSNRVYTFQMGFVGQQLPVGFHMLRYGLSHNEPETAQKGREIVDFWVSDSIMGDYFPIVWWDPADDETAGHTRGYPAFLRCMVDGMEGLLDAWRVSQAYGQPQPGWYDALCRVADHLLAVQNDDGSFFRAYATDGSVAQEYDRNTHASSRLNTPIAVRFLAKMYECTGDGRYREGALRAADFSYRELYEKLGKYVGGTPDNPNTVDKEAAIFAMYAFGAAHDLTGERKYLEAAEHAAICSMSWVYCYDYAVPHRDSADASRNPFAKGGISGFSLISTGHSGADNFASFMYFDMFKLYVKTGKPVYLHMARLLQNNTKLNSDYDGRIGYRYRAFMPEATNVADMAFRSVGAWLPWSSIANINPIAYMEDAFGGNDLTKITDSLPRLRKMLGEYGAGGRMLLPSAPGDVR